MSKEYEDAPLIVTGSLSEDQIKKIIDVINDSIESLIQLQNDELNDLIREDFIFTAKQLRDLGFGIDESIPDVAWIPKSALRFSSPTVTDDGNDSVNVSLDATINAPFRWESVTAFVKKKESDVVATGFVEAPELDIEKEKFRVEIKFANLWWRSTDPKLWLIESVEDAEFIADDMSEFHETTVRVVNNGEVIYETYYTVE